MKPTALCHVRKPGKRETGMRVEEERGSRSVPRRGEVVVGKEKGGEGEGEAPLCG